MSTLGALARLAIGNRFVSIRTKLGLFILIASSLSIGSLNLFLNSTAEKTFLDLEQKFADRNLSRVKNAISAQQTYLAQKMADWSRWDDAYYFVQGKNPRFVHANLRDPATLFPNLNIDFFAFRNADNHYPYAKSFNRTTLQYDNRLERLLPVFATLPLDRDSNGLYRLPSNEIVMIIGSRISNTDQNNPLNSIVITGLFVDQEFEKHLGEITQLKVSIVPEQIDVIEFSPASASTLRIRAPVNEDKGPQAIAFNIEIEREIYQSFLAVRDKINEYSIYGLIFLILSTYFLVSRDLITRLKSIKDWLARVDLTRPDQDRLTIEGDDELAEVMNAMNAMVDQNEKSQTELYQRNIMVIENSRMASLGEMAGGVAHEINNPLTIISSLARRNFRELATDAKINREKLATDLEKIMSTTDRIAKVVRGLRTFSRSADNDPFESVPLRQVVEETLSFCLEKFRFKGVEITLTQIPEVEIECRPTQISQVLVNLLSNSLDAIDKLTEKWVVIEFALQGQMIEIFVTDSGRGVPKEVADRIMEPFFTTKEVGRGTGLGLSISKGIAETHGGSLKLVQHHKHTRFLLSIPLKQSRSESQSITIHTAPSAKIKKAA